MVILET